MTVHRNSISQFHIAIAGQLSQTGFAVRNTALALMALGIGTSSLTFNWIIEHNSEANFFPEFAGRVVYLSDVFLLVGAMLWFLWWRLSPRKDLRYGPGYVFAPLLILTVLSMLSIIWADDAALAGFTGLRRGLLLAMYIVLVNETRRASLFVITALLAVGLLHAAVTLAQVGEGAAIGLPYLGELIDGALGYKSIGGPRAYGLGFNPNPVGLLLATTSALAFGFLILNRAKSRQARVILLMALVATFMGLMATASRSALIGWLLAVVVVTALSWPWNRAVHKAILIRLGMVMTLVILVAWGAFLASPREDGISYGLDERAKNFRLALPIIQDNLILGAGAGNYPIAMKARSNPEQYAPMHTPVHNVPLLIQAELGVVGGVAWVLIMLAPLIWIIARLKKSSIERQALLWLGPLIVLLFESLLDFTPWATQDGRVLMIAFLGLWAGGTALQRTSSRAGECEERLGIG